MTKPLPQYLTQQTVTRVCHYLQSLAQEGNYKVSFKPVAQRTIAMNSAIHGKCADISKQVVLTTNGYGHVESEKAMCDSMNTFFSTEDWKHILMAGYTKAEIVPGLEPGQAVCLYPSTTDLSYTRGMEFIEYINSFGADMGVEWTETEEAA